MLQLDVLFVELDAIGDGVDGMAEAKASVPEEADEFGEHGLERGGLGFAVDQDEDVDVGAGEKLAAAEASDGEDRQVGDGDEGLMEGIGGEMLDELREAGEDRRGIGVGKEGGAELVPGGGGGELLHGRDRLGPRASAAVEILAFPAAVLGFALRSWRGGCALADAGRSGVEQTKAFLATEAGLLHLFLYYAALGSRPG